MRWSRRWFLPITLGALLLLDACLAQVRPTPTVPVEATLESTATPGKPSVPMDVELSFSGSPTLNEEVTLVFRVKPLIDAPDTTVQIALPDGFLAIGGQLDWREDISANETKEFQVQVKAVKTGLGTITAEATSHLPGGAVFGKSASLSVNVTEISATVSAPKSSPETSETESKALETDKPSVPMDVELSFLTLPVLNEVVILTFRVRPLIDAPGTTVQIDLPEGIQAVEGQLEWQEDIPANEVREYQIRVKTVKMGLWTITAEAISYLPGGATFGRPVSLYVNVSETGVTVSEDAKQR